ncbi:hypothetical protein [Blautia sp. MSJ-19]|uniref:hypothetical protein n=1 Tax=Blautia sp. MSJ-19 TaxID=2841517 RepID=UPI001C0EDDB3|nr:hypothetical protein [Blautia sp. MSJ-19]MBU5481545.1 hypothetical protein [Blautia sp. MSJ-19]
MKRKIMLGVIAAMVVSMSVPAFAATSIGQIMPEAPQVVSGLPTDAKLVVKTIDVKDLDTYTTIQEVKTVLEAVNDENQVISVEEAATTLGVADVHNVETESGEKIDLADYKFTTEFVDLAAQIGDQLTYTIDDEGKITAKLTMETAKDKKAEDLILMLVNPETGEVCFITIDGIDPETGEIEVTLPFLGAVTLLEKTSVTE